MTVENARWAAVCMVLTLAASVAAPVRAAGKPVALHATVTGDPAGPAFIAAQIDAAIARAFGPTLPAGSVARAAGIMPAPQPLGRGFLTGFSVAVAVETPGTAPVAAGTVLVDVVNADIPSFDPPALAFHDDPEKIVADGVLSRTVVDATRPVRLYYYHENAERARRFCVVLAANGSVRTRVATVSAAAGPNRDVMSVGHAVTATFLSRRPHNEGTVVEIAGGRPQLERDSLVGPGEGIVGSLDLRVLDGGPLTVTVMAIPPQADPAAYLYAPKLPDDGHARHGTFDLRAFGRRIVAYTAGGPDATYVYGRRQPSPSNVDPADGGHDYGDYGVVQRVAFDIANPGAAATSVYVYERPLGGVVRSSFLVDGALVQVGCVRVPSRYAVSSTTLAPHATATIDVLTMTDGGSNYPLELGVTTTPPLGQAPPIGAPDGCFPKPAAAPAPPVPGPSR